MKGSGMVGGMTSGATSTLGDRSMKSSAMVCFSSSSAIPRRLIMPQKKPCNGAHSSAGSTNNIHLVGGTIQFIMVECMHTGASNKVCACVTVRGWGGGQCAGRVEKRNGADLAWQEALQNDCFQQRGQCRHGQEHDARHSMCDCDRAYSTHLCLRSAEHACMHA